MNLAEIEKRIVISLNNYNSKKLDLFSRIVSYSILLATIWITVAIGLFLSDSKQGFVILVSLALVFGINVLISRVMIKWTAKLFDCERIRPYIAYHKQIRPLGKHSVDSSFPSVHTAAMTGGLAIMVHYYSNLLLPAILVVLMLGWSRIRNGMHYPTDIIAGVLLGLAYAAAAIYLASFVNVLYIANFYK